MNTEHFVKLKNMYLRANINTYIYDSIECEIELKKCTISMTISEKYFHSLGAIHGSVYFKMLDDSAFFAVNSIIQDVFVLTTSFNTNIVKPVNSGKIIAVGKVRFESKSLFIAESTLFDDNGNEVAFGTGHFVRSRISLTKEIGYDTKIRVDDKGV